MRNPDGTRLDSSLVNKQVASEALWEMEGQMLARRSSLGQRMQEEEQCATT